MADTAIADLVPGTMPLEIEDEGEDFGKYYGRFQHSPSGSPQCRGDQSEKIGVAPATNRPNQISLGPLTPLLHPSGHGERDVHGIFRKAGRPPSAALLCG